MQASIPGTPVAIATPDLEIIDGQITTTSQQIAEHFGKRHADVIRAIRKLEVPAKFNERNFALVEMNDAKGEKRPAYRLTRDGFVLLAMGFTGKEAMQWKVAYLTAFNKMEAQLLAQAAPANDKRIEHARQLAHAATAQVYQAVFDAALNSDSSPYNIRLLLSIYDNSNTPIAHAKALEDGAFAMTLPQLTKAIRTDLMVPDTALANLAAACTQRMAEQAEIEAHRSARAQSQGQRQIQ